MLSTSCEQTGYDWSKNPIIRKKKKISTVPERRENLAATQVRKGALWNSLHASELFFCAIPRNGRAGGGWCIYK